MKYTAVGEQVEGDKDSKIYERRDLWIWPSGIMETVWHRQMAKP